MKGFILQKSRKAVAVLFAFVLAMAPFTPSLAQSYYGGELGEVGIRCTRTTWDLEASFFGFIGVTLHFADISCTNGFRDTVRI